MVHIPYFAPAAVKDIASTQSSEGCWGQCSGYHWLSGYPHGTPQSSCWHRRGTWWTSSNTIPSMAQQKCFWLRINMFVYLYSLIAHSPEVAQCLPKIYSFCPCSSQQHMPWEGPQHVIHPIKSSPSKMYSCSIFFLAYVPENHHTAWGVWHKHQGKKLQVHTEHNGWNKQWLSVI